MIETIIGVVLAALAILGGLWGARRSGRKDALRNVEKDARDADEKRAADIRKRAGDSVQSDSDGYRD